MYTFMYAYRPMYLCRSKYVCLCVCVCVCVCIWFNRYTFNPCFLTMSSQTFSLSFINSCMLCNSSESATFNPKYSAKCCQSFPHVKTSPLATLKAWKWCVSFTYIICLYLNHGFKIESSFDECYIFHRECYIFRATDYIFDFFFDHMTKKSKTGVTKCNLPVQVLEHLIVSEKN